MPRANLYLDDEAFELWNQIPLRQRSGFVADALRARKAAKASNAVEARKMKRAGAPRKPKPPVVPEGMDPDAMSQDPKDYCKHANLRGFCPEGCQ